MNRKDFVVIADMIKEMNILDKGTKIEVAKYIAKYLKREYSHFNEVKFLEYIRIKI